MMTKQLVSIFLLSSSLVLAEDTFTLGEISITDKQEAVLDVKEISNSELTSLPQKDIAKVLDTQAGITIEHKGGRAESSLMIRGLEASRIGVFVDGIPIFVPYDGNFDYSRYLSTDLASINVAKGFSSALFGANTMAGVVNLVTKKPTKELEGSFSSQLNTDDGFTKSQTINTFSIGTKQDKYYLQFSGTYQDRSHFNVSDDFTPTANQSNDERNHSDSDHKSFNLKAGYTPNDTLELVLGFNYLKSSKNQPMSTDNSISKIKYNASWPKWDSHSVYFIANKKFDTSALKFKVYRTDYKNVYEEYKSNLTALQYYDTTKAYNLGTGLEYAEYGWSDKHIVKFGFNAKKDYTTITREVDMKDDKFIDNLYSFAVEDVYQATDRLKIITSFDYDYLKPKEAITYDTTVDDLQTNKAFNPQIGFFYDSFADQTTRFTVARKTHLPTMKERFSDKKGKAIPNPDLDPEKATHFELGHQIVKDYYSFDAAIFYTSVKDPIINVDKAIRISGTWYKQEQNLGKEKLQGFETTFKYKKDNLSAGFNYTYTKTKLEDNSQLKNVEIYDVPKHQAYLYVNYSPVSYITLGGNISYKKDLLLSSDNGDFYQSSITVAGVNVDYNYSKALIFSVGVENLTDENYELNAGYPEMGREYYAKFTYNF